ncbi:MAG: hypothetical protein N2039_16300, partial [Gemmataceae bacterium]|nr:hypothetical protein [Gemmataceae bacterium]
KRQQWSDAEKSRYEQKFRAYSEAIRSGFRHLLARNFEEAIADFRQAQVQLPDDPAAGEFVEKAQQRWVAAEQGNPSGKKGGSNRSSAVAAAASLQRMRQCLREGRHTEAQEALSVALAADSEQPHPDVAAARHELEQALQQAQAQETHRRQQEQQWADKLAALAAALRSRQLNEAERFAKEAEHFDRDDPVLRVLNLQKWLLRAEEPAGEKPEK